MIDPVVLLQAHPYFAFFSRDDLCALVGVGAQYSFGRGGHIYRKGAPADCAFFILSGEVRVQDAHGSGDVYGVGTLLTPHALVHQCARSATAVAQTDCVVLTLPRSVYRHYLETQPDYAQALSAAVQAQAQGVLDAIALQVK